MRRGMMLLLALLMALSAALCAAEGIDTEEIAEFTGIIGKKMPVYRWADDDSAKLGTIAKDTVVDVFYKGRSWSRVNFGEGQGYVQTKYLERVQRKDPFQGPMPGTSEHVAVACVLKDMTFRPEGYRYPIELSAGSWLSIEKIEDGRAYFPYKRETELASISTKNLTIYDFVPWREAKPGDLLYAFTSFYSTSMTKEGNAGRLFNIELAAVRLRGTRVKAGESFSFNAVCGPYTKENGYRSAPILSGESKMGYGGGVCQVCSTLYNIVLRVPTWIEEMHWHSQGGVSYLPAGFDATVGSQSDLVFKNILPYDVRIEFEPLDGVMTAFLFRDYEDQ